jgi:hypothetical protein
MATYCQAGDTARVTFSDGSVRDFANTPIDITVTESPVCPVYTVDVTWIQTFTDGRITTGTRQNRRPPVSARVILNGAQSYIVDAVCSAGVWTGERLALVTAAAAGTIQSLEITGMVRSGTTQPVVPTYTISVTSSQGVNLFTANFTNPNYSVECVQGCPEGTLDCGDCCLDCDSIFNQISGIRSLISRIK